MQGKKINILDIYNEIKNFCETYNNWPKKYANPKTEYQKLSNRLYLQILRILKNKIWRESCNIIKNEEGKTIYDALMDLKSKYKKEEKAIFKIIEKLKNYCEKYNEFPTKCLSPKTEKEKESRDIYYALRNSNYFSVVREFKYSDDKIDNISVKTIIDYYYFKYGIKDIWVAKDSHDIAATSYYYVISIWKELENNNGEMVKYYYDSLKNLLKNKFSNFDLEEIINILNQDIDIITEYFLHKYLTCSIGNDTWIYFYKSLYEYSLYKKQNNLKKDR